MAGNTKRRFRGDLRRMDRIEVSVIVGQIPDPLNISFPGGREPVPRIVTRNQAVPDGEHAMGASYLEMLVHSIMWRVPGS